MFSNFKLKNKIIDNDDAIKSVIMLGLKYIKKDRLYDEVKNVQEVWVELSTWSCEEEEAKSASIL